MVNWAQDLENMQSLQLAKPVGMVSVTGQTALYRILDANLDRAREGLRVVEEWCRFGLENVDLTSRCKDLRQQLGRWHLPIFRAARQTETDPGTHLTHPQEIHRSDLSVVVRVNLVRVQEALRVLEEYGKLADPAMAEACKQMRYQVYLLESQLFNSIQSSSMQTPSVLYQQRLQRLQQAPLYLVTSPSDNLLAIVEAALDGGLTLVQYREKDAPDQLCLEMAQQLCRLCHRYGALFFVNDRVDIALGADADGVHLGQQDIPVALARQVLGADRLIGRSTTNPTEMAQALAEGPDYIGVGPIYATPTKPGKAAAGFDYIRHAINHASLPWFAIGGIDASNLAAVTAAGAMQVAVVRAIMAAPDPRQATQEILAQLEPAAPTQVVKRPQI
jgi:thiamine-phosphate pyrophosphorylase